MISIPFKPLQNLKFISVNLWPGCTELTPTNQINPSLVNEVHPVSARHPGNSFPIHHPQEAVPAMTNDNLFPSCLGLPLFHGP